MRVLVMGTGGLGGYFGGLLARAGESVTFVARGAHLEAIRARGLTVRSARHGELTLRVPATDDPKSAGTVDLVLFGVKTYDLEPAAELIRPCVGPETIVLPVQNGIDNAERIERVIGAGHAVGGVAVLSARVEEPGVIVHAVSGPRELTVGELDGQPRPRTERLVAALERAGIGAALSPDIRVALWQKFVGICGLTLTTLTRLPMGVLLDCPESAELARLVMEEVAAVARAKGVALPERYLEGLPSGFAPSVRQSMYYDLIAGRRLELETLNGTVVRLGRETGVPTPHNFAVYAALKPFAAGAPKVG